jgi:hypothetical protein
MNSLLINRGLYSSVSGRNTASKPSFWQSLWFALASFSA